MGSIMYLHCIESVYMKTIAIHVSKGGVGKSTIATNIGYLSSHQFKTILLDVDPQGNATSYMSKGQPEFELVDVLCGNRDLEEVLFRVNGLSVVPTRPRSRLRQYAEGELLGNPMAFKRLLRNIERTSDYDLVIFDLGPGLQALQRSVLAACNEVVAPVELELGSVSGLMAIRDEILDIQDGYDSTVKCQKLVINMINYSFRRHRQALKEFNELDFDIYTIGQDAKIAEAQYMHEPLEIYDPQSKSLPELKRLTTAILEDV